MFNHGKLKKYIYILVKENSKNNQIGGTCSTILEHGLRITTREFDDQCKMKRAHSFVDDDCSGENKFPELIVDNIPTATKCLVIIIDDPDSIGTWIHLIAWNVPNERIINEATLAKSIIGKNSFGTNIYAGPCPPPDHKIHHYRFKIYAMDAKLKLDKNTNKQQLKKAMKSHILDKGILTGNYTYEFPIPQRKS